MPITDPGERMRYNRRWRQIRRGHWLWENGPCQRCGSWTDLEVDHIDPTTKVSHSVWSWSKPRRMRELAKCQVLCRTCHQEKSTGALRVFSPCGSRQSYNKGCRCPLCRAAQSEYHRNRQKRITQYRTQSPSRQRDFLQKETV